MNFIMAKMFLRISFACFLLFCSTPGYTQTPVAVRGVLDLRAYTFNTKAPVRLSGEWNFYWQSLYTYSPTSTGAEQQLIRLPGVWNEYLWKGRKLTEDGYATFHLKLLLPKEKKFYSIEIPYMYTAYNMYIDSFLVAKNGQVSQQPNTHVSEFLPKLAGFQSSRGEADIVIQVSNFEDRKGGIWEVPRLSISEKIISLHSKNWHLNFLSLAPLFLSDYINSACILSGKKISLRCISEFFVY